MRQGKEDRGSGGEGQGGVACPWAEGGGGGGPGSWQMEPGQEGTGAQLGLCAKAMGLPSPVRLAMEPACLGTGEISWQGSPGLWGGAVGLRRSAGKGWGC